MKPSISTISSLPLALQIPLRTLWRHHIDALSDETIQRAFTYLDMRDRRSVAQVCVRWRTLVSCLLTGASNLPAVYLMPWNVLKRLFSLLDPLDITSAARVCVRWETVALSFFSAQMGRRHVHDLPAEVIKQSFALLDFDNLRYAAQVCVRWRDLGIEHPGFWSNIEVRSASSGSMDLLQARLGQSGGRPFSLDIDIEYMHPNIEARLLDLLTVVMCSVQTLHIRLNAFYIMTLWTVLNHHAPELVAFTLKLYSPDRVMPLFPISPFIFDRLPEKLREVNIEDVLLPSSIIPAFAQLRRLAVFHMSGTLEYFPDYLLESCPQLEHLTIFSGVVYYPRELSDAALDTLSRLSLLNIHLAPQALVDFVARMSTLQLDIVPVIVLTTPPDFDAAYDFLNGLYAPFNFAVVSPSVGGDQLRIIVEDDRSGYQRVFAENRATYAAPPEGNESVNPLLENAEFHEQLNLMKISISLWSLMMPYLSLFTQLRKLVVELDSATCFPILPRGGLAFPDLEILVLEAEVGVDYVAPQDIVDFIDHTLQAPHCRRLELHLVLLDGDDHPVRARFDSVYFFDPRGHQRSYIRKPRKAVR